MRLQKLNKDFSVCRVLDYSRVRMDAEYCFIGRTQDENSLVCLTSDVPENTIVRDDGWKGLCICGILDFSLVGILAELSSVLADAGIPIFVVSTYTTDYILIKEARYHQALGVLEKSGYTIVD